MIGLLGATGYTGRLVVDELARRGLSCRLGARDPDRLAAVPETGATEKVVVDASDPAGLDAFLDGADVLITTVGPFTQLGMPVVEAAVRNRVPYVDSTGEPGFMAEVYRRFAEAPVAVVPGCGFDYVPGDLAAAVAAADLGEAPTRIGVHYDIDSMLPSRGTARSALGVIGSGEGGVRQRTRVAFPDGTRDSMAWPGGETVTVARHQPAAEIEVTMATPGIAGPFLGFGATLFSTLAPLLRPVVELLPEGPPERLRTRSHFKVLAVAEGPDGRRAQVLCEGDDVYGLTARLLVEAALRLGGTGAQAPAEALDPEPYLDAVSGEGFAWHRVE